MCKGGVTYFAKTNTNSNYGPRTRVNSSRANNTTQGLRCPSKLLPMGPLLDKTLNQSQESNPARKAHGLFSDTRQSCPAPLTTTCNIDRRGQTSIFITFIFTRTQDYDCDYHRVTAMIQNKYSRALQDETQNTRSKRITSTREQPCYPRIPGTPNN